jgi:hypothetical protein
MGKRIVVAVLIGGAVALAAVNIGFDGDRQTSFGVGEIVPADQVLSASDGAEVFVMWVFSYIGLPGLLS